MYEGRRPHTKIRPKPLQAVLQGDRTEIRIQKIFIGDKMTLNDPLANAMSKILNSERISRNECLVKPSSKLIKQVLTVIKENMFLGDIEDIPDGKGGMLKISLIGKINQCGAIKPRYAIKKSDFEKFEKRYLPAKDFGILVLSTPHGVLTHYEAKKKNSGGRLLAYCY